MSGQHNNGDGGNANIIPIRTLQVGPIGIDMHDQISGYFNQYGTVNSIEIEQEDNSDARYALVEFASAETAATVLSSSSSNEIHRIDGIDVKVEAAAPWHQPDHILNALDDDCLRAILLHLDEPSLFNAANVCIRFNQQAKSVFSTEFKKLHLHQNTYEKAEQSLQHFGSVAQSIDAQSEKFQSPESRSEFETNILSLIAQCCSSKLTELTLHNFRFENALPTETQFDTSLTKLKRLSFIGCDLTNNSIRLLSICTGLQVLQLDNSFVHFDLGSLPHYDQLEELNLIKTIGFVGRFLNALIAPNSQLKKLFIRISRSNTIRSVVQNLPNLQELNISMKKKSMDAEFTESIRYLACLKSLKVLTFKLNGKPLEPLALILNTNAIPIERLRLIKGTINMDGVKAIARMKQLKALELCNIGGLTNAHMMELTLGLCTRLEKLRLEGATTAENLTTNGLKRMLALARKLTHLTMESTKFTVFDEDYNEMLGMVRKTPERISLLIKLTGKKRQIHVPEEILLENQRIFYIDEEIDHVENENDNSNENNVRFDSNFSFANRRFSL